MSAWTGWNQRVDTMGEDVDGVVEDDRGFAERAAMKREDVVSMLDRADTFLKRVDMMDPSRRRDGGG